MSLISTSVAHVGHRTITIVFDQAHEKWSTFLFRQFMEWMSPNFLPGDIKDIRYLVILTSLRLASYLFFQSYNEYLLLRKMHQSQVSILGQTPQPLRRRRLTKTTPMAITDGHGPLLEDHIGTSGSK